jgi:hypothetical protein
VEFYRLDTRVLGETACPHLWYRILRTFIFTQRIEAAGSSETLVPVYKTSWYYSQKDYLESYSDWGSRNTVSICLLLRIIHSLSPVIYFIQIFVYLPLIFTELVLVVCVFLEPRLG